MSKNSDALFSIRADTALLAVLLPQREHITARWVEIVHGTYPFDTIGFLRTHKNRFANPVGYRTEEAAKALIEILFTKEPDEDSLRKAVEEIIRVRAVQDFSPERAVGVIFALKDIVREQARSSGRLAEMASALMLLESRIDAVALMAFGAYARVRETLHRLKVAEFKRKYSQILRLAEKKAEKLTMADNNPG